jgi:hypothetical protein
MVNEQQGISKGMAVFILEAAFFCAWCLGLYHIEEGMDMVVLDSGLNGMAFFTAHRHLPERYLQVASTT